MKTYTLSYYRTGVETTVRRRPWWNIFGRDKLWARTFEDRRVITGLTEDETDVILRMVHGDLRDLFIQLLGTEPRMLQLEQENHPSPYVETQRTNLIKKNS